MRLFFVSDLHMDAGRGTDSAVSLADWVTDEGEPQDVLILGGDYGNDDDTVNRCLDMFRSFPGRTLAIAGNHDVWVSEEESSLDRYRRLGDLFRTAGFHPLEEEPVVIGDVGFVGALGWYDYSFRVPELDVPMEVYRRKSMPGAGTPVWMDGVFVRWDFTDEEMTNRQVDRLRSHLEQLGDVSKIIVAIHHVPTEALLRPKMLPDFMPRRLVVPHKWLVLNTYLGSRRFGELLAGYADRIEVALCGHIHLGRRVVENGITYASNGSDYRSKEVVVYDPPELWRKKF